jgi:hypothetical protein
MSSDSSKKAGFPETEPTATTSAESRVPDTTPEPNHAPFPETKPAATSSISKVPAPSAARSASIKPDRVDPPLQRNARPYSGQRLGVKHEKGIDPIEGKFINLALVDLKWVKDHLEPWEKTRVLDHAPWTGLPIVELS